jgi:MYXO-CTERM domain-containing protein
MFVLAVAGIAGATPFTDSFDSYAGNVSLTNCSGWYSDAGPTIVAGGGVNGSNGLSSSSNIFNWQAHPFSWGSMSVGDKVVTKMDFQAGGNNDWFDDDRVGWTTNGASTSTSYPNVFGAQLDTPDGGAPNTAMEAYWKTSGGTQVYAKMGNITGIVSGSWYRFELDITKLSGSSAALAGTVTLLDSSGNPTSTTWTGSLADTSAYSSPCPAAYFTNTLTPIYKNFSSASGDADNASFEVVSTPEPATMSLLVLGGLAALRRRMR